MRLPFTPDQFFDVFAEYNEALWPVVVAFWLTTVGWLVTTWRNPAAHNRALTYLLGAQWAWSAVVYHLWFFSRINPAAWLFGGFFALQAVLLLWAGARQKIAYFSSSGLMPRVGASLTIYAIAYPFLTMAFGHRYPAVPTFGVPCPTVILTIGLFLTTRSVPRNLAILPILWGFIGGSAAVLLAVPTDYVLLGAGMLLAVAVLTMTRTPAPVGRRG